MTTGIIFLMPTVSKGVLKSKMLEYFREVEKSGKPLIVTDHGIQVLEIRPLRENKIDLDAFLQKTRASAKKNNHNIFASAWSDDEDDSWWTKPQKKRSNKK